MLAGEGRVSLAMAGRSFRTDGTDCRKGGTEPASRRTRVSSPCAPPHLAAFRGAALQLVLAVQQPINH
jgi:hypothetical protein